MLFYFYPENQINVKFIDVIIYCLFKFFKKMLYRLSLLRVLQNC